MLKFRLHDLYTRVRRDVQEGTWDEMIDNLGDDNEDIPIEKKASGNDTVSERSKRQADFPGTPEQNQDSSK